MLHCAAALLAVALFVPLVGLADGVPDPGQILAVGALAAGLASLLQRFLGR